MHSVRSSDQKFSQMLYLEVKHGLTKSGKRMLGLLLKHGKHGLTRAQLARLMDKPRLCRYDIELLKQLEDKGYIVAERRNLFDDDERSEYGGMLPPTWNYVYEVNPRLRPYFNEISKLARQRKKGEKDKTPLLQRLVDLIS